MSDFLTENLNPLVNLASDVITNVTNGFIAGKNLKFQKEAFNYQKELNNLVMQREDNAISRRMKDLQSAGLSPYLAAGSAAGSASLSTGSAPHNPFIMSTKDYNFQTKKQRELLAAEVSKAQAESSEAQTRAKFVKDNPSLLFQDNFFNRLQFIQGQLKDAGLPTSPQELGSFIKNSIKNAKLEDKNDKVINIQKDKSFWKQMNEIVDVSKLSHTERVYINEVHSQLLSRGYNSVNVDTVLGLALKSIKSKKIYLSKYQEVNRILNTNGYPIRRK